MKPENFADLSIADLLQLRARVDQELAGRGQSAAIGDIGEGIAIAYFASRPDLSTLLPSARGTKNVDAISRDGERYSIKTLMKAKKTGTIYPAPLGDDRPLFEYLLIVTLSNDYALERMYRVSWKQFLDLRSWDKRMNAWYLARSARVLGAVEELTYSGG